MQDLTPEARRRLDDIAARHGVSSDAALILLRALAAGNGVMAQFSHPELGGIGQWLRSGMVMVGDMFNAGLKGRVDALCTEIAALLRDNAPFAGTAAGAGHGVPAGDAWWPAELGAPASSGGQNGVRYAYFPASQRLAVQQGGRLSLHDTGPHRISGVSQQQGAGGSLVFSTDGGAVRVQDLPLAGEGAAEARAPAPTSGGTANGDPLALIERLAELRAKGVLTAEEFDTKKAELLRRL